MLIDFNSEKPIYLQLAEAIEDNILKGIFQEETQIISTTEISVKYKINPATAGKGVNVLVDEDPIQEKGCRYVCFHRRQGKDTKKTQEKLFTGLYTAFDG